MESPQPSKALLNKADALFRKECQFIKSIVNISEVPKERIPEFAFLGRSNVGKSTLLNALANRKALAYASKTPGRTRALNFFTLANTISLVDLPGYGFAKVPYEEKNEWSYLLWDYLKSRRSLNRLFLLIDARHGIKSNDIEMLTALNSIAISTQIILTKMDKVKLLDHEKLLKKTYELSQIHPVCHPHILITSSTKKTGLSLLRAEIYTLVYPV